MKLAIIRSEISYTKGGAERYAANLCRELCQMGHQVWVLAEIFADDIHPDLIHIPIKVNRTTSSQRTLSFHNNAQRALQELEVDAVLALSRSFPADAFRVSDPLHRFWMKIRYPGRIHRFLQSLNPRHRAILKMERGILDPKNTRMIITNSQLSKTLIGEYYQYPAERIHVIYNGVDHSQFTADTSLRMDEEIQLLFVGQDFKRKGLSHIIDALAIVRNAGHRCTLRVIGRDDPTPYQSHAARLGIAEHITFEGPTRAIQDAYRSADLFIFPSHYDPFANVVLESLACGLPALTTTTNGSSEIISEGKTGYVINYSREHLAQDIAQRTISFCQLSPTARRDMRLASRATAEAYSITSNATSLLEKLAR